MHWILFVSRVLPSLRRMLMTKNVKNDASKTWDKFKQIQFFYSILQSFDLNSHVLRLLKMPIAKLFSFYSSRKKRYTKEALKNWKWDSTDMWCFFISFRLALDEIKKICSWYEKKETFQKFYLHSFSTKTCLKYLFSLRPQYTNWIVISENLVGDQSYTT